MGVRGGLLHSWINIYCKFRKITILTVYSLDTTKKKNSFMPLDSSKTWNCQFHTSLKKYLRVCIYIYMFHFSKPNQTSVTKRRKSFLFTSKNTSCFGCQLIQTRMNCVWDSVSRMMTANSENLQEQVFFLFLFCLY